MQHSLRSFAEWADQLDFGLVSGPIDAHLDTLEEFVHRWSLWFRDRIRAGESEARLIPDFAHREADDLQAGGATKEEAIDYETADPSFMAVGAALRYWSKYHPEEIAQSPPESH